MDRSDERRQAGGAGGTASRSQRARRAKPCRRDEVVRHPEADVILHTLCALVEPLSRIVPGECEVLVHDLCLLPNSIIAVAGNVTGRGVGGPATDKLLRAQARGELVSAIGHETFTVDGRRLRSDNLVIRATDGTPVAALCINCDTRSWEAVAALVQGLLPQPEGGPGARAAAAGAAEPPETFTQDVDEVASELLDRALASAGIPVSLMHKRHKLAVVRDLKERGYFILREAVERAAQALGVTRFTIYNYLREIDAETGGTAAASAPSAGGD